MEKLNHYANTKKYRQTEKGRKSRLKSKLKNYSKTALYGKRNDFTQKQDEMILAHYITDTELSAKIHHSVESIQIRRSRLKRKFALINE